MQAFHYETVDSTNEQAKRLMREGLITDRAYLLAREQTAGRGSRGRGWCSPKDAGIYLSVAQITPTKIGMVTTTLTLAAGVACVEALRTTVGVEVNLKPINDLYLNGRKLGGILTEAIVRNGRVDAVVIGVGINLGNVDHCLPGDAPRSTSLETALGSGWDKTFDLDETVAALIARIVHWSERVFRGHNDEVERAWHRYRLGAPITDEP